RGDQLVGQARLLRTGAHERLGQRDRRAVDRFGRRAVALLQPDRIAVLAVLDRLQQLLAAAPHDVRRDAADLRQLAPPSGRALGQLHPRRVAQDGADRPVLARGRALAPGAELARHGALARIEAADAREPAPDLERIALVGRLGDRHALLARPLQPALL